MTADHAPTRNEPHAFVGTGDERCKYSSCGRHRTAALHEIHDAASRDHAALTWAVIDAVRWQRVSVASWPTRAAAEEAIASWQRRQAKGKRPDIDLSTMVLIPVPDELVRRAEQGACATKRADEATARTFQLSERISQERERADGVRPLLAEVVRAAMGHIVEDGGIYRLPANSVWRRAWEEASRA